MNWRTPPTEAECIEALEVMIEAYGVRRTEAMLEKALENLKAERR